MRSLSSPVCPHFSLRGSRLPGESGLTQLALIARLVTHRVPIQPFHLRVGYATILLKATLPQSGPFGRTLETTDTRRTLFLNPSPSSTTTSITKAIHTRLPISFSTAFPEWDQIQDPVGSDLLAPYFCTFELDLDP